MIIDTRTVTYGQDEISFDVAYADRKTLEISVYPDQHVLVRAPFGTDFSKVDNRVKRRARWITKQKRFFKQFDPRTPPRKFVSGETHLYLGKQYRLKIERHIQKAVKLIGGHIRIQTHKPACRDTTQQLLDDWYLERAKIKLQERYDSCFEHFSSNGFEQPPLAIRRIPYRWGSLTPSGQILLNRDLIRAPLDCIDYVVIHELCHMEHPNHSRAFYKTLSKILPDWEERKYKLEHTLI